MIDLRAQALPHDGGDLPRFGMAVQGGLGEDQVAVQRHLEAALARALQLDGVDDVGPSVEQFVRQTDGLGDVVSGDAELDLQLVLVRH